MQLRSLVLQLIILTAATAAVAATSTSNTNDHTQQFLAWFAAAGGLSSGLELHQQAGGVQVVVSQRIEHGSLLLSVPLDIVISRKVVEAAGTVWRNLCARLSHDDELLAVFLVVQKNMGEASKWAPYLKLVPQDIPVLSSFSMSELDALQDEILKMDALRQRAYLQRRFKSMSQDVHSLCHALKLIASKVWTFESFVWAFSVVSSRALTMTGVRYLVPFADMFGYRPSTLSREVGSGSHFLKYHRLHRENRAFEVLADHDMLPTAIVTEDYGDMDNSWFLQNHGFLPSTNPFDCIRIALPQPTTTHPRLGYLLEALGVSSKHQCVGVQTFSGPVSLALIILEASELQLQHIIDCADAASNSSSDGLTYAHVAECVGGVSAGVHLMRQLLSERAAAFPTTAQLDTVILNGGPATVFGRVQLTTRERLAVQFRIQQKTLVHQLVHLCNVSLSSVPCHHVATGLLPASTDAIAFVDKLVAASHGLNAFLKEHAGGLGSAAGASLVFPAESRRTGSACAHAELFASDDIRAHTAFDIPLDAVLVPPAMPEYQPLESHPMLPSPEVEDRLSANDTRLTLTVMSLLVQNDTTRNAVWQRQRDLSLGPLEGALALSDEALAASANTSTACRAWKRRNLISLQYAALKQPGDNPQLYRIARAVVESRSVWLGDTRLLVAGLDLVAAASARQAVHVQRSSNHRLTWATPQAYATAESLSIGRDTQGLADYRDFLYHGIQGEIMGVQCLFVTVQICPASPQFHWQRMVLWQHGRYDLSFDACITSSLWRADSWATADPATHDLLRFVSAATRVSSFRSLQSSMARLLFQLAAATKGVKSASSFVQAEVTELLRLAPAVMPELTCDATVDICVNAGSDCDRGDSVAHKCGVCVAVCAEQDPLTALL